MTVDCADGRCMVVLIEQRAQAHRGETEMKMTKFFRFEYVDAEGKNCLQVNIDGFEVLLQSQSATQIMKSAITEKQLRAYIKG